MEKQYELNRGWIYPQNNPHGDPIGQANFVVSAKFFQEFYEERYAEKWGDIDLFIEAYVPEEDGEAFYQEAIRRGELIEDLGIVYDEDFGEQEYNNTEECVEREVRRMEKVTLKEYEAAKAAVLYGKEYEETSSMENNVIYKQYVCKDGGGIFYERIENGVTEFWSTTYCESRTYADKAEEKVELSKKRRKAIKRLYKLLYWFADEMLNEEDAEKRETAVFEEQQKKEPDKLQMRVSAHDNNASIMKDCIRETRDAAEFLKSGENDVEEWQIAGINAMFDQCIEERIIPYDLPAAIKGLLCMHILCKPLCLDVVAEK